ncbi:hypothetical protein CVT24_009651 [Panaeolus cyanescens]|uniref:Uncharacterized protein n=1 Tax=Panaeolus cyanescens TaxID=181874 RepID=A0A409Y9Z2_9AGAR|nr:hypothetical protein CVT24_009651 [Panaeolus cyanescens]
MAMSHDTHPRTVDGAGLSEGSDAGNAVTTSAGHDENTGNAVSGPSQSSGNAIPTTGVTALLEHAGAQDTACTASPNTATSTNDSQREETVVVNLEPPPADIATETTASPSLSTTTAAEQISLSMATSPATSPISPSNAQTITIEDIPPGLLDDTPADPPPPYPSGSTRSRRTRSFRNANTGSRRSSRTRQVQEETGHSSENEEENAPLLGGHLSVQSSPRTGYPHSTNPPGHAHIHSHPHGHPHSHHARPHSISHGSTHSAAPSLAQTVLSLFNTEDDVHLDDETDDDDMGSGGSGEGEDTHLLSVVSADESLLHDQRSVDGDSLSVVGHGVGRRMRKGVVMGDKRWWKRYFRPLKRASYYRPLLHLAVINFPFALAAWVYLFVFTVTGTTLLVALPIGVLLCFFDLIGARLFSRAELALQSRFHPSLALVAPYPPRPIFTRWREATVEELENGDSAGLTRNRMRNGMVKEKSFYKNSYAMFTDSTSYQALFYFIVIKPAITLLISLFIIVFVLPSFIFVLPAPAMLRAVRRIGVWQAGVAIEGLYLAVR